MSANRKVVLIVPPQLLALTDQAARTLQMSRLAFIRQAMVARLVSFKESEEAAFVGLLDSIGSKA